jgi:hypothetical protein
MHCVPVACGARGRGEGGGGGGKAGGRRRAAEMARRLARCLLCVCASHASHASHRLHRPPRLTRWRPPPAPCARARSPVGWALEGTLLHAGAARCLLPGARGGALSAPGRWAAALAGDLRGGWHSCRHSRGGMIMRPGGGGAARRRRRRRPGGSARHAVALPPRSDASSGDLGGAGMHQSESEPPTADNALLSGGVEERAMIARIWRGWVRLLAAWQRLAWCRVVVQWSGARVEAPRRTGGSTSAPCGAGPRHNRASLPLDIAELVCGQAD